MNKKEMEAELIGALIGDGYISTACKKYIVGFTGHPKNDLEYYKYLSNIIQKIWCKRIIARERAGGLRMKIYSKNICLYLIKDVGLIAGNTKSFSVEIPKKFVENKKVLPYVIRGIADTDGSIFFSKKSGINKYPAIELTTCSLNLANQLRFSLIDFGFRVTNLRNYFSKKAKHKTYKVCLYGKFNLSLWMKKIGFSNDIKRIKAEDLLSDA